MKAHFSATGTFARGDEAWDKYIEFSGLTQLNEVVSLDGILCPPLVKKIEPDYWPHIVQEDFTLPFFWDFDFLAKAVAGIQKKNVLCVYRNPLQRPVSPAGGNFQFLGYDLLDLNNSISPLTNCGGYPDVFMNSELSVHGLLPDLDRAVDVQQSLRCKHPGDFHADCNVWAIFRLAA